MSDIEKIEHVYKTIKHIHKCKDKERRIQYLSTHQSEELQRVVWYAYNPLFTFGISTEDLDNYTGTISEEVEFVDFFQILADLQMRNIIGKAACGVALSSKVVYSQDIYELLRMIINKDLGLGVDASDLNNIFNSKKWDKLYIPLQYDETLAKKYQDRHKKNKYKQPAA